LRSPLIESLPVSVRSAHERCLRLGIWKTFNVMVLTALGSAHSRWNCRVGVPRKKLHALMRMALLTSFLAYAASSSARHRCGRPWNFYWIVFPWKWNMHSRCRSRDLHVDLRHDSLALETYRRFWSGSVFDSRLRPGVERLERGLHKFFPGSLPRVPVAGNAPIVARTLMLLAGNVSIPYGRRRGCLFVPRRGHFMSFGCVAGTTMLCCTVYRGRWTWKFWTRLRASPRG